VTLQGHTAMVRSFAFSPDGRQLVSGSDDHMIKIWDFNSRSLNNKSTESVLAVTFSEDGRLIAAGFWLGSVSVWETSTGQLRRYFTRNGHPVTAVAISPDGQLVVCGDKGGRVMAWNTMTGEQKASVDIGDGRDEWTVHSASIILSPDGNLVAFSSEDHFVIFNTQLWRKEAGPMRSPNGRPIHGMTFSPSGQSIAIACDGELFISSWYNDSHSLQFRIPSYSLNGRRIRFSSRRIQLVCDAGIFYRPALGISPKWMRRIGGRRCQG
jgi:WD40 repeat protein